jgi:hypothetical protein
MAAGVCGGPAVAEHGAVAAEHGAVLLHVPGDLPPAGV